MWAGQVRERFLTLFFSNFQFSSWAKIWSTTAMASFPWWIYSRSWSGMGGSRGQPGVCTPLGSWLVLSLDTPHTSHGSLTQPDTVGAGLPGPEGFWGQERWLRLLPTGPGHEADQWA